MSGGSVEYNVRLVPDSAKLLECYALATELAGDLPWNDMAIELRDSLAEVLRNADVQQQPGEGCRPAD